MDFRRPVEAVIPGVQGRILAVLAETTAELNLRTIARLSGASPAQASRVLPELVALGLVERREAPPSALFLLIEDNVAGRLVRALSRSRDKVLGELGALAGQMDPTPVSAIVFGSLARGEGDALSDVDLVLVRPAGVDEDDELWASSAEGWRTSARRLTGNPVQVIEIDETEIVRRLRRPNALWANVLREGVVVHGLSLESIRGRRIA
ncbi:MAG TPA: helix-turn-helix domain-containing protein [Acidimicrobiales bacterium]|nr:helix-turn-helix domain-containing protein [Acidimicrobiales bacterium]